MDATKILDADVLDIVFEGRNKAYGAYELRKTYNRRLARALGFTAGVIVFIFVVGFVSAHSGGTTKLPPKVDDVSLEDYKKEKLPDPLPPPPKPLEQKIEMKQFTPPKIVKNEDVKEDEKPPVNDQLDDVKIGTVNTDGAKDDGTVGPPAPVGDGGKGVVEAPKKDDDGPVFLPVEYESQYPGGVQAWARFLNKNLRYPEEAQNNQIQGQVVVQFIVDKDGNVSDVVAVSGPEQGGLREEAVRVIKKSGKWTPGNQNGKPVKSYKRQPVTFTISE